MNKATAARGEAGQKPGAVAETIEIVKTVVYALLIALVIRTLACSSLTPSPRRPMEPNLYQGDYIIVSKWSYGYSRHSLIFSPPIFSGRIFFQPPKRGDIIVFKLPRDGHTDYIKRLIGLPGDKVQVKAGALIINGKAVNEKQTATITTSDRGAPESAAVLRETNPEGRSYLTQVHGANGPADNTGVYVVPPHCYFMMGDNRDNSADSRFDSGSGAGGPQIGRLRLGQPTGRSRRLRYRRGLRSGGESGRQGPDHHAVLDRQGGAVQALDLDHSAASGAFLPHPQVRPAGPSGAEMARRADALGALERRIGYAFADRALLEQALTHASAGKGAPAPIHNERLEFLGDRVLGLLAAEALMARDPHWREGELSRRHAGLVSGEACAEAARRIDIGAALRLAGSATKQGGRANERILGDAMEALIAAVYLDGGAEAARAALRARLATSPWPQPSGEAPRTRRRALQEWAMAAGAARCRSTASFRAAGPDHAPRFVVEVESMTARWLRAAGSAADGRKGRGGVAAGREGAGRMSRAGFAAVIGAPNAGKSTLVNRLVGSKVTIVTQKAQTTRFPVRGVAMAARRRSCWSIRPASSAPRRRLDRAMVRAAWAGAADADAVVHLVDAEAELAAAGAGAKRRQAGRRGRAHGHRGR